MKKWLLATLVVAAGLTAVSSTFAFNPQGGQRMGHDPETKAQLMEVLENKDYTSFLDLFEGTRMLDRIDSQEAFEEVADKFLERQTTREENQANRQAHREEMEANHEAMKDAIENGDYETWKELAPEQLTEIIDSEAKFERLQEMHSLHEQARTIAEELGLQDMRQEMREERMENHPNMMNRMKRWFGMWNPMESNEIE